MENRSHALLAGLFTLLLGAALVAAVLWFQGDTSDSRRYVLVSERGVEGLNPQAAVRYRGVAVGKVEKIALDPKNRRTVLVEISVDRTTPVSTATYGVLGYQGITGLSYVRLEDDNKVGEPLPQTPDAMTGIELRPSFLDQFGSSGQEIVASVSEIGDRIKLLLSDENRAHVVNTLESLDSAAERIAQLAADLKPAVHALPGVAAELERAMQPLPEMIAHIDRGVQELPELRKDASKTLRSVEQTFDNLNRLAIDLRERVATLDGTASKVSNSVTSSAESFGDASDAVLGSTLPKLERLIADLSANSRRLDRLLVEWRERPQSLIFGGTERVPGPGEAGFAPPPAQGSGAR